MFLNVLQLKGVRSYALTLLPITTYISFCRFGDPITASALMEKVRHRLVINGANTLWKVLNKKNALYNYYFHLNSTL